MTEDHDTPRGDPWNAFGYVVAGVLLYGLVGFGLDRWWGTGFMVAIGIMCGAVLGLYMTWARFKAPPDTGPAPPSSTSTDSPSSPSHPTEPQR
ncbi:hypothetical protein [Nocardioides sp.]|uniref:hypothetical protein n=1 Tax=Nocardioides sp. TaxID=35761 RepID=UPI002B26558B|nr:hypothetical protein [Nocardioides sp.]